jgi:hypothetical protein
VSGTTKTKLSTSNVQRATLNGWRGVQLFGSWKVKVESWTFSVALLSCLSVFAQSPVPPQPDPLMQLMLTQPSIDISTNVEVRAVFDPPVIGLGEKVHVSRHDQCSERFDQVAG